MGNCCCGPLSTESCGWPRGTIRALLALLVILVCLLVTGTSELIFIFRNEYVYALGIQNVITGIISIIIGYYFGTKTADAATQAITESSERLLMAKDRELEMLRENHERALRNIRSVRVIGRKKKKENAEIVLPNVTDNPNDVNIHIDNL